MTSGSALTILPFASEQPLCHLPDERLGRIRRWFNSSAELIAGPLCGIPCGPSILHGTKSARLRALDRVGLHHEVAWHISSLVAASSSSSTLVTGDQSHQGLIHHDRRYSYDDAEPLAR